MPTLTPLNNWDYACIIFLAALIISCNDRTPELENIKWENLDAGKSIYFYVTDRGKGEKGDVYLKYAGYISNKKFITDTVSIKDVMFGVLIKPVILKSETIKELSKGSSGFIKINVTGFFLQSLRDITHYTLFFSSGNKEDTEKDSLQLAALSKFEKIKITSSNKAIAEFEKDNDTSWKQFIKSNPLPESIELTLKKEFLTMEKYDSVKKTLMKLFPGAELHSSFDNGIFDIGDDSEKAMIYKFVIF